MTTTNSRVLLFTASVVLAALASLFLSHTVSPLPISGPTWIVLAVLVVISLASELLAVTISEQGSITTMEYVPHLGAILLVGPAGAGVLTVSAISLYQVLFTDNPWSKRIFNVAQLTLTACVAGIAYCLLGGTPSLTTFDFSAIALPFLAAVIVYFMLNRAIVTSVIALAQDTSVRETWQDISYSPFAFDIVGSSLALAVAFLYVQWGPIALIATLVPIVGLRYSYGVNLELKQLNSDLLRVLIKTIEAQDPYTSGHSIRVAEGAIAIARELGLNSRTINHIETAALLHDIGKIDSAFREILRQEGPLTAEQRKLIRNHPERGVELVRSVRALDEAVLDYIKHHHERYDGTGYPDSLEGDEIPVGARIIMVSDSIDAMVTKRPYRDALSRSETISELRKHEGTQFDPTVVEAALSAGLLQSTGGDATFLD